jgi:hypothetical protein
MAQSLLRAHALLADGLRRLPHGSAVALSVAVVAWLAFTTTQPFVRPGTRVATPTPVDPARLEADVGALATRLGPRDASHVDGLTRAAAWIAEELARSGGRVDIQTFHASRIGLDGATYRNVVGSFGPSGEDAERVVVGAHYDACGPLPGADDDASGVAGLLELARQLGATPALPTRVDLVAFASEEPPFFGSNDMGSARHAAALAGRGVRVRAMLTLEMIGFFSDAPDSQRFPSPVLLPFYPSRGDFIALVGRSDEASLARVVKGAMTGATSLPVRSMTAPVVVAGADLSDHRSYWNAGYRAMMVTDTAFLRNGAYHTARDLPETLDYARMADVVRGVYAAVVTLAK